MCPFGLTGSNMFINSGTGGLYVGPCVTHIEIFSRTFLLVSENQTAKMQKNHNDAATDKYRCHNTKALQL
jgi:hypothetical protein